MEQRTNRERKHVLTNWVEEGLPEPQFYSEWEKYGKDKVNVDT